MAAPPEYRWRPLLNAVEEISKCRSGTIWGGKNGAPFSAATRPTYMKPGSYG